MTERKRIEDCPRAIPPKDGCPDADYCAMCCMLAEAMDFVAQCQSPQHPGWARARAIVVKFETVIP